MPKATLGEIVQEIREGDSFLLLSHAAPDGDAIGSMLCMYHLLRAIGKNDVTCLNDDTVPRIYSWLPGAELLQSSAAFSAPLPASHAIVVDAASKARVGAAGNLVEPNARWIAIDHHPDERSTMDLAFVDPAYSAVGEILVELFDEAQIPLSIEAATCAYVSITTDTGGFRYANTTARSHRIAARLIEAGVDAAEVSSRVFDMMSVAKFDIMKRVVERIQRIADGRVAYSMLTLKDLRETSAKSEDVDGLINFARNIEGVELGIMFRETGPLATKVSMRSRRSFNCGEFLEALGGGGHAGAAGATIEMSLTETRRMILERVRSALGVLA